MSNQLYHLSCFLPPFQFSSHVSMLKPIPQASEVQNFLSSSSWALSCLQDFVWAVYFTEILFPPCFICFWGFSLTLLSRDRLSLSCNLCSLTYFTSCTYQNFITMCGHSHLLPHTISSLWQGRLSLTQTKSQWSRTFRYRLKTERRV